MMARAMMNSTAERKSQHRARQRRHRERRKRGVIVAPTEISDSVFHMLVNLGFLEPLEEDSKEIGAAASAFLEESASGD